MHVFKGEVKFFWWKFLVTKRGGPFLPSVLAEQERAFGRSSAHVHSFSVTERRATSSAQLREWFIAPLVFQIRPKHWRRWRQLPEKKILERREVKSMRFLRINDFFFKKSLKVLGKCSVMNVSRIQRPIDLALSIEEKHRAKHVRVQNPEWISWWQMCSYECMTSVNGVHLIWRSRPRGTQKQTRGLKALEDSSNNHQCQNQSEPSQTHTSFFFEIKIHTSAACKREN